MQEQYDEITGKGASFAVIKTGANRQSVQLADIDADGVDEVVSFFKTTNGVFHIYIHKKNGDGYEEIGNVEGVGHNIKSVEYIRYKDTGALCIAVNWELGETAQSAMSVYAVVNGVAKNLQDIQAANYIVSDLDLDSKEEILSIAKDSVKGVNVAKLYGFTNDKCVLMGEVSLSIESDKVLNIVDGFNASGEKSIFIDSSATRAKYVTDMLIYKDGLLLNGSVDAQTGSGVLTSRDFNMYCKDIDGDGIIEIPLTTMLKGYVDANSADTRWKISWKKMENDKIQKSSTDTFNNVAQDWFLYWPESWGDDVTATVRSEVGVSKTTFFVPEKLSNSTYSLTSSENNIVLEVYVYTGENRVENAQMSGVKIMYRTQTAVFGYKTYENDKVKYLLTTEQIEQALSFNKNEWTYEGDIS